MSKSVSYSDSSSADEEGDYLEYPMNVRYQNMYYYLFAPTLCYEINFPKNDKIRFPFLFRRLLEIFILIQIEIILVQQWIVPNLEVALPKILERDSGYMLERFLRLVVPNNIVWLILFYLIFHSLLNFLGELLKFADREFYRDWWNAKHILDFWQLWNIPVHKWCVRHLYKPLLKNGYSKLTANLIVFTFSAIFHEYVISVPVQMLRFYAFTGMFMQIPLSLISNLAYKFDKNMGNMIVWLSLIVGQPVACMMYAFDFVHETNTISYLLGYQ